MLTAQERAAEEGVEEKKKPEEVKAQLKAAAPHLQNEAKPEDEKSGMMSNDITVVW